MQAQIKKMAVLGTGNLLGHEDVMDNRNYTTTVICKSNNAALYVCKADAFHSILAKDDKAAQILSDMCI